MNSSKPKEIHGNNLKSKNTGYTVSIRYIYVSVKYITSLDTPLHTYVTHVPQKLERYACEEI